MSPLCSCADSRDGGAARMSYGQDMRLSVLTLVVMTLVGALLWLRGAPGEGAVLIAAAAPLAWWSSQRRCDAPPGS
jgi:hypothetical protein